VITGIVILLLVIACGCGLDSPGSGQGSVIMVMSIRVPKIDGEFIDLFIDLSSQEGLYSVPD
jgi:hypothetical protein